MSPRYNRNCARSMRAQFALRSYLLPGGEGLAAEDLDTGIIDLLADLRHFCDTRGLCFGDLDGMAYDHYLAERHDGEGGAS